MMTARLEVRFSVLAIYEPLFDAKLRFVAYLALIIFLLTKWSCRLLTFVRKMPVVRSEVYILSPLAPIAGSLVLRLAASAPTGSLF
jgi:hypothetical protein